MNIVEQKAWEEYPTPLDNEPFISKGFIAEKNREGYIKGYNQAIKDKLENIEIKEKIEEDKNIKIKRRIEGYLDEINQQSNAYYCTKQQLKDILEDILELV